MGPSIILGKDDSECKKEINLTELIQTFKSKWPVDQWKTWGLFNEDYLFEIDVYWLQFPPPSPTSHYVLGILYVVIMIIGVLGNVLIIFMFLR